MYKILIIIFIVTLMCSCSSSSYNTGNWKRPIENIDTLLIKDIEGYGMDYNYSGKNIAIANK